ncbi:hypothetical protein [Variovorax sp. GT1P44]|uniref:hypothetical protein n=1 Tax=Variovorax sp. GT1P44 TaxID=3443742 RepID=UPI003F463157
MHAASISIIPPGTGGVRDYATAIGGQLETPLLELTRTTDTSSLSGDFLLLHFSGYGFQKRGVPMWLVRKVRSLRTQFKAVGIVFHELFAPAGSPLGSAFWLNRYQKRIARQLLMLSDFWLTNREESGRWLQDQSQAAPYRVLPVFSTVGEPPSINADREPRLVVFGSSAVRANVYNWSDGEIFRCAKRAGLEIHDIGPTMQDTTLAQRLAQEGVVTHGKLSAEDVSHALSTAAYGALSYPPDYVSKSSVFSAYSAHGICPILLWQDYGSHDGLTANVHYAAGFTALDSSIIDARAVGRAARQWYEPHSVSAHVSALRALITEARK